MLVVDFLPLNYCKLESLFIQHSSVNCHVRMSELSLNYVFAYGTLLLHITQPFKFHNSRYNFFFNYFFDSIIQQQAVF